MMRTLPYVLAFLLNAAPAIAQAPAADVLRQARTHFREGLAQAQQGDLNAALREFEAAYAIQPHFSVLYNIGQAHATLGQPVEAAAAFERYLQDGGEELPAGRRREVETTLAAMRSRIGQLRIVLHPNNTARVWLDGVELSADRLANPISVATGKHTVLQASDTVAVQSRVVAVSSSEVTELRLSASAVQRAATAQLIVRCEVPGVTVQITGVPRLTTPLATPVLVPDGPLTVSFSRAGYAPSTVSLTAKTSTPSRVTCGQRPITPLPAALSARLVVTATPSDAEITLDGEPLRNAALPAGLHQLTVQRDGYRPLSKLVEVRVGRTSVQHVTLIPTSASRERNRLASAKRRMAGVMLGGIGVVALASSVSVYAWNSGRYDDWQAQQKDPNSRSDALTSSIQRADDISIGLGILSAGFLVGGSLLFFGAE